MKSEVTRTTTTCDFCNSTESTYEACANCGLDICYDCKKTKGVEYKHAIYFSGSGDGFYCDRCHSELTAEPNPLFIAYKKIQLLRLEMNSFSADFKVRQEEAEANLKRLKGGD